MIDTAIIYSRVNSKRLKNKAFKKIYKHKTLIEKVIENTLKIKSIKKIIIATTFGKKDQKFKLLKKKYNIEVFQGSTNDLMERTINCSKKYKFNYFLRVCGDRPFFDFKYIDKLISKLNSLKNIRYDLITNNKKDKFVDQGLTVEILSVNSLKNINRSFLTKYNKENITSFYYDNSKKFNIKYTKSPTNWFRNNKYTIDTIKDLNKMKFMLSKIKKEKFNINHASKILKTYKYEN